MRMFAALFFGSFLAFGQAVISTGTVTPAPGALMVASFNIGGFQAPGVTGAPYSAEETSTNTQILADGNRITRPGPGLKVYRDSQGRTRTERSMGPQRIPGSPMPAPPPGPVIVQINDPVEGAIYVLDPFQKVAHRVKAAAPPSSAVKPLPPGAVVQQAPQRPGMPQTVREQLGTQVIGNLIAQGERTTTTVPAGLQGNERPIVTVSEVWTSVDLKVQLKRTQKSSQNENAMELINISRLAPDPALFLPPAGYAIVDEAGGFSISSPRQ